MPVTMHRLWAGAIVLSLAAAPAQADRGGVGLGWLVSTSAGGTVLPEVPADDRQAEGDAARMRASLGAAFDAEVLRYRRQQPPPPPGDTAAAADPSAPIRALGPAGMRDLIASVEAGRAGYDAIHLSAKVLPAEAAQPR